MLINKNYSVSFYPNGILKYIKELRPIVMYTMVKREAVRLTFEEAEKLADHLSMIDGKKYYTPYNPL